MWERTQTKRLSRPAAHWDQTQAVCYIWIESMDIKPKMSVYVPYLMPSMCDCNYLGWWQCSIDFQQQHGREATPSESYVARIPVKISRICDFHVIMGIMTGLLGCCSSSTLRSKANDYVKTFTTPGFWLHHSPCSLRCWTINTLVARSLSPKKPMGFLWDSDDARVVMHA